MTKTIDDKVALGLATIGYAAADPDNKDAERSLTEKETVKFADMTTNQQTVYLLDATAFRSEKAEACK